MSLFPQAEEPVHVTFSPPRATDTASGAIPFGVRVQSREDPEGSVVEEGTLNVAEFSEVTAELTPHATRVWLRGRSQVAVDNRSNISYRAELAGTDTDSAFDYSFRPRSWTSPRVRLRSRRSPCGRRLATGEARPLPSHIKWHCGNRG